MESTLQALNDPLREKLPLFQRSSFFLLLFRLTGRSCIVLASKLILLLLVSWVPLFISVENMIKDLGETYWMVLIIPEKRAPLNTPLVGDASRRGKHGGTDEM